MPKSGSAKTAQIENSDSDSTMVEKPTARKVIKLYSCLFKFGEIKNMYCITAFPAVMKNTYLYSHSECTEKKIECSFLHAFTCKFGNRI